MDKNKYCLFIKQYFTLGAYVKMIDTLFHYGKKVDKYNSWLIRNGVDQQTGTKFYECTRLL